MPKTAFVTGASGFLGLNLIKELISKDWQIHIIHRPTSNLEPLAGFDIFKHEGSLENPDSLISAIPENVDAVFHVAGSTNLWFKHNQTQYQTNVVGTQNMLKAARLKNAGRFIHTSSIASYGLHHQRINENTTSNAMQSGINYFVTKYLAEQEVKKSVSEGMDAVILNPAHIVGPYDRHNWVQMFTNVFHEKLPGVPAAIGMFTYAPEVAKAHINAFEKGHVGENYLLGGVQASMLEFVNAIETVMNKPLSRKTTADWMLKAVTSWYQLVSTFTQQEPLLTPEKTKLLTHNVLCDDSKAQSQLDFKLVSLNTIVSETYNWLQRENLLPA